MTHDRDWMINAKCRAYDAEATEATTGVWGGVFVNRPAMTWGGPHGPKAEFRHGTPAGARRHYRAGETPCPACLQASRIEKAHRRRSSRAVRRKVAAT